MKYSINIDYTNDPNSIMETREREGGTITLFIAFCMHATGIYRLFDEGTIREFFYRMAIIFKSYEIVPKFFMNDTLIVFEDRGKKIVLDMNDVLSHLGMEISDCAADMIKREDWLKRIGEQWKQACIGAIYSDIPLIDIVSMGNNRFKVGSHKPKFEDEYAKLATLFESEAMKTIGPEQIQQLSERVVARQKELNEYRLFLETKPKHTYEYANIPFDVKKRFFKMIFGNPVSKLKEEFEEAVIDQESTLGVLIHLTWLWVNGYVSVNKVSIRRRIPAFFAEVDDRIAFNYEKYEGLNKLGIGINLYDTYFDYNLNKLAYLLKEKKQ